MTPEPYYADDAVTIIAGDCLDVLAGMPAASVDAVVTDPPYGLGFMGKEWDGLPPGRVWAEACLRVLKPGGYLLAFGGSRTWHRLAVAVEDGGFELRDSIAWLYGSGFPKSLDVSKAIDRQRSEDRAPVDAVRAWLNEKRIAAGFSHDAVNKHFGHASNGGGSSSAWMTNPTSRSLPTWDQWQSLRGLFGFDDEMDAEVWRLNGRKGKPGDAFGDREVIGQATRGNAGFSAEMVPRPWKATVGQKHDLTAPATDAAKHWAGWGTALKPAFEPIVVGRKPLAGTVAANVLTHSTGALNIDACRVGSPGDKRAAGTRRYRSHGFEPGVTDGDVQDAPHDGMGRWPTNVVLDDTQAADLDRQTGVLTSGANPTRRGSDKFRDAYGEFTGQEECTPARGADSGGASRFFPTFHYEAKAPTAERPRGDDGTSHPTVKPLDLMRWLVRLVTPPGGLVLDPFLGSGTTAEACVMENLRCVGIEREPAYLPLAVARLSKPIAVGFDFGVSGVSV